MWLIVGLGNPGSKYTYNWHNSGYMALEVLAQRNDISLKNSKFKGEYGKGRIAGKPAILLRPKTFMNLSGQSIREAMAYFKVPLNKVVVIFDDIDIPRGTIRVRDSGGAGTHNGMKSVVAELGSKDFSRVRIGCGPVPDQWDLAAYVLSDIPKEHQETLFASFVEAAQAVETLVGSNE